MEVEIGGYELADDGVVFPVLFSHLIAYFSILASRHGKVMSVLLGLQRSRQNDAPI